MVHLVGVVQGVCLVHHCALQLAFLANLRYSRIRDRKIVRQIDRQREPKRQRKKEENRRGREGTKKKIIIYL